MDRELSDKEKMLIDLIDVRFVAWNAEKGKLLEKSRGKKSRRQLAEEIKAVGGRCSHTNLQNLEYGIAEMVSVEVLQGICVALDTSMDKFVTLYVLRLPL